MPDTTLQGTYVTICDWQGQVVWHSRSDAIVKSGDFAWQGLQEDAVEQAKTAFSRAVTLRGKVVIEFESKRNEFFRAWLWPLHSPDMAVCVLSISIPREMKLLTEREREVLSRLGDGLSTREIAADLDVSTSTIHTHLRRSRQKLGLEGMEARTGFAARYCRPFGAPTDQDKQEEP